MEVRDLKAPAARLTARVLADDAVEPPFEAAGQPEIRPVDRQHERVISGPLRALGQFGRLLRSLQLTLEGPDPASPEGQRRIAERGASSIRGILNLVGRKLDLVSEYEARVPAYVEQMFDRLEASVIIVGWDRDDWEIWTTTIGLNIRISPKAKGEVASG